MLCLAEQTLNAIHLILVGSDANDFEALNLTVFAGFKFVCLSYLPCAEEFLIIGRSPTITRLLQSHRGHIRKGISAKVEQSEEVKTRIKQNSAPK